MTTATPRQAGESDTPRIGTAEIAEILRTFERSQWESMRLTVGGVTVAVGKNGPPPAPAAASAPDRVGQSAAGPAESRTAPASVPAETPATTRPVVASAPLDETGLVAVTSPTVGTFWVAPEPGSGPFVEVGSRIEAGDQLAIVEVMKLMNPVVSEVAGEIVAVRAQDAELVEFGQPLFLVRPDD
ncbi:acetyl-CoA carboxylase biotin carboxyl carrier protein [Nocardia higoensis]|uniref:acetyl-CoA carboxylase biotin carboxyl carrier protein n=1 Tax=Nocardia higoensis TaxID=228599 RepID=UPI00030F1A61|nr:biotin/lipoyl-containing protein [Nocardia higoensis]